MKAHILKSCALILVTAHLTFCQEKPTQITNAGKQEVKKYDIEKTPEEWRKLLTPEQYSILREKETEYPGTGKYDKFTEKGSYYCAGCDQLLFESTTKFDAGCGWPSFYKAANSKGIDEHKDSTLGMVRIEILCSKCGGHLGHVFPDGPQPTGLRYCVNSASLEFKPQEIK